MALRKPIISEIADRTWLINEYGCNNMYVLEGSTRSLVIDAGMGYCNFREIVEELTDRPYDVAITHAHPDHIGMMHQFDTIHMNKKDMHERFEWMTRLDFDVEEFHWNNRQHIGNWEVWEVTEDMINRGDKNTQIIFIDEGHVFDLGDRQVSAYFMPGHSPGHLYFIDNYSRIAFTGDCVNHDNGSRPVPASTFIRYLLKFLSMHGKEYDRIFTGHSNYCGILDVRCHDINIVRNLVEAYRALLRGEATIQEVPNHLHPEIMRKVVVYGSQDTARGGKRLGDPIVRPNVPEKLWEDGEEHIIP